MNFFKRKRTVNGKDVESSHWYAWVVDSKTGKRKRWNTQCRLKEAAEEALRRYRSQNELVAHGLRPSPALEANLRKPLTEHAKDYVRYVESKNRSAEYLYTLANYLRITITGGGWMSSADANLDSFYEFRSALTKKGKSAKTVKEYQAALAAFFKWLKAVNRIPFNPLENIDRVTVDGRKKRVRRVVSPVEFQRLLDVAGDRALAYFVVVNMGLRRGDGDALTWGDFIDLDGSSPCWISRADDAKVHEKNVLPLHPELAQALLAARPATWKPNDKVFPGKLPSMYCFYKDLKAAGIKPIDEKGERVDLHALRTTFGTHLKDSEMPFAQAKKFLRHKYDKMTSEAYYRPSTANLSAALTKVPVLGSLKKGASKWAQTIGLHGHELSRIDKNNYSEDSPQPVDSKENSPELSATGTDGPHPGNGCPARIRT